MESTVIPAPAWLRGGPRPLHVAPAVILGAVAGATAGWNLTFALLVTLALLHYGPLVTTIVAAAVAAVAVQIGANLTTAVGSFCCEKVGLGALIESLGHGPLISLLGWHDYELLGGAMLALVLSLPAAHALTRRRNTLNDDDAEPVAAPLLRPWGCTTAVVWMLAAAATLHVAAPQRVAESLLKQISAAAGAPVTADRMHYDLFSGRLHLDGVRVRDLDEPGRVALRVDTVIAEVEPGLLLRGRLHADRIELAGLTYDADPHAADPPKLFRSEQPPVLGYRDAAAEARSLDPTQPVEAASFVRDWNELPARLSALGRLITAVESTADLEIGHAVAAQRLQAVRKPSLEPRDAISGRTLPLVQIKLLQITDLPSTWSLGETARVELVNLTSRPATTPRGVQLTLEAPARRSQLTIDFRLTSGDRRHEVALSCDSCSAADVVDLRRAAAVGIETTATSTLALRGRGSVGRDRLELALACDVVGFRPTATAARFGNLDAAVWRAGIERLGGLRLDATLAGRWSEPHLQITPAAIVDQLKHQLRSVGEHGLVKAVEAGRIASPPALTPPPVAAKAEPTTERKSAPPSAVAAAMQVAVGAPTGSSTTTVPPNAIAPNTAPAAPLPPVAPSAVAASTSLVNQAVVSKPTTGNVTPATAVAELRQPASVLDPSSTPGRINETVGGRDPFAVAVARTRPTAPLPTVAAQPASAPPTGKPIETAPRATVPPVTNPKPTQSAAIVPPSGGAAIVISDDASPTNEQASRPSLVSKWFDFEKKAEQVQPPTTAGAPTVRPSTPTPAPQTAAKPWFPRVRKFLDTEFGDEEEEFAAVPEEALVERGPSTTQGDPSERPARPAQQPPVMTPVPQTAKTPWYEKMFR